MRAKVLFLVSLLCLPACGDAVPLPCGGPPVNPAPRGGAVTAAPQADMAPPDLAPDAR